MLAVLGPFPALAETFDGRRAVIIDGDTIALGYERVRISNIDAPETWGSRCERELVAGLKAKERLAALLRGGSLTVDREGHDRYRRTLARLSVGGRDVGRSSFAKDSPCRGIAVRKPRRRRLRHCSWGDIA